jgi:hypothetical protein
MEILRRALLGHCDSRRKSACGQNPRSFLRMRATLQRPYVDCGTTTLLMALSPAPISLARTPKVAAWPRFGSGFGSGSRFGFATRLGTSFALLLATLVPAGCESSLHSVDQATNEKLRASAEQLKGGAIYPQLEPNTYEPGSYFPEYPKDVAAPATDNPAASDLKFESVKREKEDAASITKRFEAMEKRADNTRVLTFDDAVAYALEHSEEYLNAEEAYLLVAIRLLIEEHRWEPIPSNITTAGYTSNGGGSRFDNALSIVNELGASQKLPFGGDVSARTSRCSADSATSRRRTSSSRGATSCTRRVRSSSSAGTSTSTCPTTTSTSCCSSRASPTDGARSSAAPTSRRAPRHS